MESEVVMASVAMDAHRHDETWEEHKKHFHHGKEPAGRCEWRDRHGGGSRIVKPRGHWETPYGTGGLYSPEPGPRTDSLSRDPSRYGKKDRRTLDERLSSVRDEVREPCEELFSALADKGIVISPELKKSSLALMCGLDVDESVIKDIPEVKAASDRYDEYAAKRRAEHLPAATGYDYSGKRTALRAGVLKKFRSPTIDKSTNMELGDGESYDVEKGRRIDIVTGMPAAGKSSTFVGPLSRKFRSRLCDPDQIKTFLPEYSDGLGAGIVHNESKVLCRDVLYYAMDAGENIVFPTLGGDGNIGRLIRIAEDAHSRGYEVHMHFNDIDRNKAIGRMLYRLAQTGRFIPLHYFDDNFRRPYDVFGRYCDSQERVEQGAGKGVVPKRVDFRRHTLPEGKFRPTDEARTSYFYAADRMPPPSSPKRGPGKRGGGDAVDDDAGMSLDEILYDWYA